MRAVAGVAAALLVAFPVARADAAAKRKPPPSCHVVTDVTGDATGLAAGVASPEEDQGLDLTGAELATSAAKATVVFRLPNVTTFDFLAPTGRMFVFTYTVGGRQRSISAVIAATGETWGSGGPGTYGSVVAAAKEIHVTVPAAEAGLAGVKAGTTLSGLTASSFRWTAAGPAGDPADVASGGKVTYKHGSPSCLKVGS